MTSNLSRRDVLKAIPAGTAALAVGLSGAGATLGAPALQETGGGTLTFGYDQQTSYSHFMFLRDYAGGENIYARIFANAKLLVLSKDRSIYEPDLAERWEFSEDGLTLTFYLRQGLTWHDGEPFTAADVEFTFLMQSMPGLGPDNMGNKFVSFFVGQKELIETGTTMSGMHVLDDYTISFDLLAPVNPETLYERLNGSCIAPKHLLSQYLDRDKAKDILADPWATTAAHVGLGPFRVVEYVPDQYVVYEPFENYWRGRPVLDKLIYRSFADSLTVSAALENDEIDVGWIPESEYERMQEIDSLYFHLAKTQAFHGSPFNTRQTALSDKRVRQALLLAVDREALVETIWKNATTVVHSPIDVPRFGDSPNLIKYPYDPERAKQLLTEAGWDPERKLRWTMGELPADDTLFAAINDYWAAVGVQTEYQIIGQDDSKMMAPEWDFDLYRSAYPLASPATVAGHLDARICTHSCPGLSNPRMEELFDAYLQVKTEDEYKQIVFELQDIISDEVPYLMLARIANIWGLNTRVTGLEPIYGVSNNWEMEKVTVTA